MATSRHVSYCQPYQDERTRSETSSKEEYEDGSQTLTDLEKVLEKVTMIERWVSREGDTLNRFMKNYQLMRKRFDEDIGECKLQLLNLYRRQEEKTRGMKKLNLLIFETADVGLKRTDEQSKRKAESLCVIATNTFIPVEWATQLDESLPGMIVTRVRFFSEEDKLLVLSGEENLLRRGVYLDHDLTKNQVAIQMSVDELAEEARASGKSAFVRHNTVCIDGTYHTFV